MQAFKPSQSDALIRRHYLLKLTSDKPSGVEGFPLRRWSMQLFLLNEHGDEMPASVYSKATYHLHESFGKRAVQGKHVSNMPMFSSSLLYSFTHSFGAQPSQPHLSRSRKKDGASSICTLSLQLSKRVAKLPYTTTSISRNPTTKQSILS